MFDGIPALSIVMGYVPCVPRVPTEHSPFGWPSSVEVEWYGHCPRWQSLNVTWPGDTVIDRVVGRTLTVAFVLPPGIVVVCAALLTTPIPPIARIPTINTAHTLLTTVSPLAINELAAIRPPRDPDLQAGNTERQHGHGGEQQRADGP